MENVEGDDTIEDMRDVYEESDILKVRDTGGIGGVKSTVEALGDSLNIEEKDKEAEVHCGMEGDSTDEVEVEDQITVGDQSTGCSDYPFLHWGGEFS